MPVQPTDHEAAYFAREEFRKLKEREEKTRQQLAEAEKKRLQELHYMNCPKCGMKLVEIDYNHIKIDKCTGCEGVWLDAGELEAVSKLEKSLADKFFSVFKK
jgi:hypothetical protein